MHRYREAWALIDGASLFGMGGHGGSVDDISSASEWRRYVETLQSDRPDDFELAIGRIDTFVWAFVDGRRVPETEVDPDLGMLSPGLGVYEGIAECRDIEVQLLDDNIAELLKLP